MSSKRGGFDLTNIGRGDARTDSVRRTARSFFHAEEAAAVSDEDGREREDSTPPVESSRGEVSSRGVSDARPKATRPPVQRDDSSSGADSTSDASGQQRRATWRQPREDGRLRANDRAVLDYLRSRMPEEGNTTEEVGMREIADECEVSHRTAQNTVLRLQEARIIARIPPALGSNKGCRYRILKAAPRPKFGRAAS